MATRFEEAKTEMEEEFALAATEGPSEWVAIEPAVGIGKFSSTTNEIRTTSSTGGQKGVKPEMFSLIPVEALEIMARLYGFGAKKYAAHNWRKGYEWSKSFDSLFRHAFAALRGEDIDEETGLPHLAGAAFHCFTLMVFMQEHPEFDDRFKKKIEEVTETITDGLGNVMLEYSYGIENIDLKFPTGDEVAGVDFDIPEEENIKAVSFDQELAEIMYDAQRDRAMTWQQLMIKAALDDKSMEYLLYNSFLDSARAALKAGYFRMKD